jgi:signal peptidase I
VTSVVVAVLPLAGALAIAAALLSALRRRMLVVTLSGSSMSPTYCAGDRLLVRRTGVDQVCRGEVVVVIRPEQGAPEGWPRELMVKRVVAVAGDPVPPGVPVPEVHVPEGRLVLVGDNPARGYDSRTTGYFDAAALIGVVVRRVDAGRGRTRWEP